MLERDSLISNTEAPIQVKIYKEKPIYDLKKKPYMINEAININEYSISSKVFLLSGKSFAQRNSHTAPANMVPIEKLIMSL